MKKRIMSVLTALALCVSLPPAAAFAAEERARLPDENRIFEEHSASLDGQVMPLADTGASDIQYVKGDGTTDTASGATPVTGGDTVWQTGWYYVPQDTEITGAVTAGGAVSLVLGGNLTAGGGITIEAGGSLTVYAREGASGLKLTAANQKGSGIQFTGAGTLDAASAAVSAAGSDAGICGSGTGVIALNGTITASGGQYGIRNVGENGVRKSVVISGGEINIHGEECGIYSGGVTQTGGTVTITGGSCALRGGSPSDEISIQGGKMILDSPRCIDSASFAAGMAGHLFVVVNQRQCPYGGEFSSSKPLDLSTMTPGSYYEVISNTNTTGYAILGDDGALTLHNATLYALDGLTAGLTVNLEGESNLGDDVQASGIRLNVPLTLKGDGSLTNHGTLALTGNNTLTLSGNSSFINRGSVQCADVSREAGAKLTNYNTMTLTGAAANDIKGLDISGSGIVIIGSTHYDNHGKDLDAAGKVKNGDLDLSAQTSDASADGYQWDAGSKTLTIQNLMIMGKLTLPAGTQNITLCVSGNCLITEGLTSAYDVNEASITIKPERAGDAATLTINDEINIASGSRQALVISPGVTVKAQEVFVSGSNTDADVQVNGALVVNSQRDYGITTGKMTIGASGELAVSGENGIKLIGYVNGESNADTFKIENGGLLLIDCELHALEAVGIQAQGNEKVFNIPDGVLPDPYGVCTGTNPSDPTDVGYTIALKDQPPEYRGSNIGFVGGFSGLSLGDPKKNLFLAEVKLDNPIFTGKTKGILVALNGKLCTEDTDYTLEPSPAEMDLIHVGKIPYKLTAKGATYFGVKSGTLEILPAPTAVALKAYNNDGEETQTFTYGDTITVKAAQEGEGEKAASMDLYYNEKKIAGAVPDGSGGFTMQYHTTDGFVPYNKEVELTVKYTYNGTAVDAGKIRVTIAKANAGGDSTGTGSGGGGAPSYSILVKKTEHGAVEADKSYARAGETVILTVKPEEGYILQSLAVSDATGDRISLTTISGPKYSFVMPRSNMTVTAVFADAAAGDSGTDCPSLAFTDLNTESWYHEAVDYVLKENLMNGVGNSLFLPDGTLSRAMLTQILYNREGRPERAGASPFTDVIQGRWYTDAIIWANQKGVIGGYGSGQFGPDDPITREQLALMLWRYAGNPAASGKELNFTDADEAGAYARDALRWAVEKGILNGTGDGRLDPRGPATRAQVAAMLMRYLNDTKA